MSQSILARCLLIAVITVMAATGCNKGDSSGVYAVSAEDKVRSIHGLSYSASLSYTRVLEDGTSTPVEFTICTDVPMSERKMGGIDGADYSVQYDLYAQSFAGMVGNDQIFQVPEKFTMTDVEITITVSNGKTYTDTVGSGTILDTKYELFDIKAAMPLPK